MPNVIEVIELSKRYGNVTAIESLTFSVRAGSLFGFLGSNGSGKSTTIACLSGLTDPTSGIVRLFGKRFDSSSVELKRRIGVMPENLGLFDYLRAEEFLTFRGRMYGLGAAETRRRVDELLDALDLAGEADKPLGKFSSGMRKRVAFAAAILHGPELLFLDEPFESVDPAGVALMKSWLRRFTALGRTVFLTTHVLDTAEKLCDHAAIIHKGGRLIWQGAIPPSTDDERGPADKPFTSLEGLFLSLTGERYASLDWL